MKLTFNYYRLSFFIISFSFFLSVKAQELYEKPAGEETRWYSFENITGGKGEGGKENKGAKGHPVDQVLAGETVTLMETKESGIINRIWLTIDDRSPEMLRSLKIEMYWDGEEKPAVSVPLGDFFGVGLGKRVPFENALFSDPEGRSLNSIIPMPFKKGAKVTITNESDRDLNALFFDINIQKKNFEKDILYFHAYWSRDLEPELGEDFNILPEIKGTGRFLGTNVGINTNPDYGKSWWGEGEVKIYLDGDTDFATLVGTGAEDYIGTAWGQGTFNNKYQGSLIADEEKGEQAFYRYHIPDPVYFHENIKVTIQLIGGWPGEQVRELVEKGASLKPVTVSDGPNLIKLLEMENTPNIMEEDFPEGWTNFYRQDDISATGYFYLDEPVSNLSELQDLETRISNLDQEIKNN